MKTQSSRPLMPRWTTLKGLAAIIVFLIIAIIIEYFIVLYAINLGVQEKPENTIFGLVSPMFHFVPIAVIITLLFSWTYLTRHIAVKPHEINKGKIGPSTKKAKASKLSRIFGRIKSGLLRVTGITYLWKKIHFARAAIKSASIILLVFAALILTVSILAYPSLIYETISDAYQNNSSLLNFVKNIAGAFAPIGGVFSAINDAILSASPGFKDSVSSLGNVLKPLVNLDDAAKYLVFQNIAAWVPSILVLFYSEFSNRSYRYKKK